MSTALRRTFLAALVSAMASPSLWAQRQATPPTPGAGRSDQADIEQVLKRQFDKPEAPLAVSPIVVEGDFALAGWTQGHRGGRALLKRDQRHWSIHVCGGDGLKQVSALTLAGLPKASAQSLVEQLTRAEKALPPARVRLFSSFEGMVKVEGGAHAAH